MHDHSSVAGQHASSSQPIALPVHHPQHDVHMASPSSFAAGGQFNPASYTRALFGGSPISWRGSFGAQNNLYPGTSPSQQLFGSFDPNAAKLSSSIDSDRAAYLRTQDDLCRNYTCCGLSLPDLHALVEHFEEAHVVVLDPSQTHNSSLLPNALPHMHAIYAQQLHQQHQQPPQAQQHPQQMHPTHQLQHQQPHPPAYYPPGSAPAAASFDPADDMELDLENSPTSSSPSSPPHTPPYVPAIQTQVPYVPAPYSTLSSQPSSACPSPVSAFDTTAVLPSRAKQAFNAYPAFGTMHDGIEQPSQPELAVAPAMLFGARQQQQQQQAAAAAVAAAVKVQQLDKINTQPIAGPSASNFSPTTASAPSPPQSSPSPPSSSAPAKETPRASTTLSRPASSLLLSKPFRCPKPNCNKSYKQANGLKYHITHGSCSFAPPKDLEALQALLAEKGLDSAGALSESDAREVEREAERRLRPFACAVGDCTRRYKNMNGLRYHYQHSGEHGAEGLRLLASGQHECLQHHNSRGGSKPRTSQLQQQQQQQQAATTTQAQTAGQGGQTWYGQQYAWQQQQQVHVQTPSQAQTQPQVHI